MSHILQWNCRGLISKWSEMKALFSVLTPILIALQETWFQPTDSYNFSLRNYSLYRYDEIAAGRRHGGTALYVSNNFTNCQIPLNTTLQAVASSIRLNGRMIDVCSLYIPPDFDNTGLLRDLDNLVTQFQNPYLILGDFNAHSPVWSNGTQAVDNRGRIVENFLDKNNLVILNKGMNTYHHLPSGTETAIDLSICSPGIGTLFDWTVDSDIYNSDHFPIKLFTTFSPHDDDITSFLPRWNLNKANWIKFEELCLNFDENFDLPEDGVEKIKTVIMNAATRTIPLTRPPPRRIPVPWWTDEVKKAVARRKRAFRSYRRNRDVQHLLERNQERARTRRVIRAAKRHSWQHYLSQFTSATPLGKLWGLVRSLSGKRSSYSLPILRVNNELISDTRDITNALAQSVSHCCSSGNYQPDFIVHAENRFALPRHCFLSDNTEDYNAPFSLTELLTAIKSAGNTSVGPDNLHYSFFRHLPENMLNFILNVFNKLWITNTFPELWKDSFVIPLLKPGKDAKDPANYRPIALTSCLGKLLERMVAKRLSWLVERHQLISQNQCGFRQNRTTMDHIIRLETDIRKSFRQRQTTTAVFLDIKRAYDMVYKPALVYKLFKLGFRGHLAYYLTGFLSGVRSFKVRCRSTFSDLHFLENGLPQGSCLSPILFNFFIDDLFDLLPTGISSSLYADDSAIWCSDVDPDHSMQRLQDALNIVQEWSRKHGLQFSAKKSAVMIFKKFSRTTSSFRLRLGEHVIPVVSSFKFLGIVLDPRLSMIKHTEHIRKKCMKRVNLFRCISGSKFGADRATLLRLYKSLVLPIIEYGSVVYAGGCKTALNEVVKIQNLFLRIALGVLRTSPIPALEVESNIMPLKFRRMELTLRYISKIAQIPNHPASAAVKVLPNIHHNYIGPAERRSGLTIASRVNICCSTLGFVVPSSSVPTKLIVSPWRLKHCNVSFLFSDCKRFATNEYVQQKFNHFLAQNPTSRFIYTDGSKSDTRTGCALICSCQFIYKTRLPNDASVFSGELLAILFALYHIKQQNHITRTNVICSDSHSALQSLLNPAYKNDLVIEIANLHHKLCERGASIKFLWIPGHCGISGNERVDNLAKQALALNDITSIPTDLTTIKSQIRMLTRRCWQEEWNQNNTFTQLREIKPKILPWLSATRKDRLEEKTLARLRIGHTWLTHSYLFLSQARPTCQRCNQIESVKHILLHCVQYQDERRFLQSYCQHSNLDLTLKTLLGDDHPDLINYLFRFLRDTSLLGKL